MLSAEELIGLLKLEPMGHENLLFRQTWCSPRNAERPAGTCIYGLLLDAPNSFSDIHRLQSDEIWHFYLGDPIELLLLHADGSDELLLLGQDISAGQHVQFVVPARTWMGARLRGGGPCGYGLFGNTMAPGFTLEGFELPDPSRLLEQYPGRAALIRALSRL